MQVFFVLITFSYKIVNTEITTAHDTSVKQFTFSAKVWLKRFFLLKIFEDLYHTAAFPNRVP